MTEEQEKEYERMYENALTAGYVENEYPDKDGIEYVQQTKKEFKAFISSLLSTQKKQLTEKLKGKKVAKPAKHKSVFCKSCSYNQGIDDAINLINNE